MMHDVWKDKKKSNYITSDIYKKLTNYWDLEHFENKLVAGKKNSIGERCQRVLESTPIG